jgi:hypothetical protein
MSGTPLFKKIWSGNSEEEEPLWLTWQTHMGKPDSLKALSQSFWITSFI